MSKTLRAHELARIASKGDAAEREIQVARATGRALRIVTRHRCKYCTRCLKHFIVHGQLCGTRLRRSLCTRRSQRDRRTFGIWQVTQSVARTFSSRF